MKKPELFKAVFILAVALSLLMLCGCAAKEVAEQKETIAGEIEAPEEAVPESEYEITTVDIESDLDLSELEGIDEELEKISW